MKLLPFNSKAIIQTALAMNTPSRPPRTLPTALRLSRVVALLLPLATFTSGWAQTVAPVPLIINYQGRVTDATGLPIGATGSAAAPVAGTTNRKIIFRIYDAATGGTRLWTEEQTATIATGEFSVLLGQGINATGTANGESRPALDTVFNSLATSGSARYLEVMVDNGDNTITGGDSPISPRQQLTTTAYSFRAKVADAVAAGADLQLNSSANYGLGWYGSGRVFNGVAIDGPVLYGFGGGALGSVNGATQVNALRWNATGQVGIGSSDLANAGNSKLVLQGDDTGAPPTQLNIRGATNPTTKRLLVGYNTTGNYGAVQAYNGASAGTALSLNQAGGNVGIGNANPTAALDVTGGIRVRGDTGGYSFNFGDLDGGLFSPADGVLTLNTNGAEKVRVDGSGNVGVGTTAPFAKIHAVGQGSAYPATSGTTPSSGLIMRLRDASNLILDMGGNAGSGFWLQSTDALNFASRYHLLLNPNGGNVGVNSGTAGALAPLSVVSSYPKTTAIPANNRVFLVSTNESANPFGVDIRLNGHASSSADRVALMQTGDINGSDSGVLSFQPYGGNVGIGTTTPVAKLEVNGWMNTTIAAGKYFDAPNGGINTYNQTSVNLSIKASNNIVASAFNAASDERIKSIKGLSNGTADLQSLMRLQVTDYSFKDKIGMGGAEQKKLIAQQVEKVYPLAVDKTTSVVPDIFQKAMIKDGWILLKTNLKPGENVRLMTKNGTTTLATVAEVEAGRFRTATQPAGDELFVYGREVNDFRTVDYSAISMLNVSATQQIKKEKDAEVKALQHENAALKARLSDLEAKEKARDAKLAALEKTLLSVGKPAAQAVSLKKGDGAE